MADKRIVLAVAGSGKTRYLVNQLNLTSRLLVLTYTNNNYENLRLRIIKKFGCWPQNIKLSTYFSFLHTDCYKPYLQSKYKTKGIEFLLRPNLYAAGINQFISKHKRLYSNRLAKLIIKENVVDDIINRIVKYYDYLLIDEIQDFAGNDFNLLLQLVKANIKMLFVGDYYQHTYDTSIDGRVNNNLFYDYDKYKQLFAKKGVIVDTTTLIKSYRCSKSVCDFVVSTLGVKIESKNSSITTVEFINDPNRVLEIVKSNEIIKLFYKEHYKYDCKSLNWGASKGMDDFNDVCIVLYKSALAKYLAGKLKDLEATVKNKFYVACTRAKGNLYFIPDTHLAKK